MKILTLTWKIAWAITLVCLPLTSFPLLSKAVGGTYVAPLSIMPLFWLCLTFLPIVFFTKQPFPPETKTLFIFVIAALISSAAAYFLDIPPYKGFTLIRNNLEAFLTLGIGLAFYFTTVAMIRSVADLKSTLIYINIGGIIVLLWSVTQISMAWLNNGIFPVWMERIQSSISISKLVGNMGHFRVFGTTLEPSWLAHCLNMLYLPLWLGNSATNTTVFRFRIFKLSIENYLLAIGIFVLIFTYSRIGLISFGLVFVWLILSKSKSFAQKISTRFSSIQHKTNRSLQLLLATLLVVILIISLGGIVLGLSSNDNRYAKFLQINSEDIFDTNNFMVLANRAAIAERVVYWDLGMTVFKGHPIIGVGLGNVGMFTLKDISYYAWKLPELRRVMFVDSHLPNSKNLWVRLLAETGLIGFIIFVIWLLNLGHTSNQILKASSPLVRTIGLVSQFSLIALILEGFSIDSFALPYLWVAFGLLSATSSLEDNVIKSAIFREAPV